jgi:hypothetical protein
MLQLPGKIPSTILNREYFHLLTEILCTSSNKSMELK